jgi:hypothetical protein
MIRFILSPLLWLICSDARVAGVARQLCLIAFYTWLIQATFRNTGVGGTPKAWALALVGALIYYFPIQVTLAFIYGRPGPPPPLRRRLLLHLLFLLTLAAMVAIWFWLVSLLTPIEALRATRG